MTTRRNGDTDMNCGPRSLPQSPPDLMVLISATILLEGRHPSPTMQSVPLGHISSRCCPSRPQPSRARNAVNISQTCISITPKSLPSPSGRPQPAGCRHTSCCAVINTEVSTADSWALSNRAAMLSLKVEQLDEYIQSNSGAYAWLAVCEPQRLFALRELCKLLDADVGVVLQLVQQETELLDVPATSLEDNIRGIQALLQLPRRAVVQLLCAAPDLMLAGPKALEGHLQRVCRGLGLSSSAPGAATLLQLLPRLGIEALLDPLVAVQKLSPFFSTLSITPADAMLLLWAEVAAVHDLQQLLSAPSTEALSREWHALSDEVGIPLNELMGLLAAQVVLPDARYLPTSSQLLKADITALQDASQLGATTACRMLLAAPRLARVPESFWQLLLQYILFLVPQWRQQLEAMPASQAGIILSQLFDAAGCDVVDTVPVTQQQAMFATADVDYNQELAVLEALLDQGVSAPRFTAPGELSAGRLWRLIYMCNPRLDAAQQAQATADSSSSWGGAWSWVFKLQLPVPLVNQMQQQGALSCDIAQHEARLAAGAVVGPEVVESLADVVAADSGVFCGRHPGYPHWLHNAAFELEWANSKAAAPVQTWDP